MPRTVILSPHLDDAPLNCWHLLTQPESMIMNVFAGLPPEGTHAFWDRLCGEADSHQMMQLRRAENEVAVELSDNRTPQIYLDFLDKQYRKERLGADELADAIAAEVPAVERYYAPLALSRAFRHVDHVLVRQATLALQARGYKVGFYPDGPYMNPPRRVSQTALKHLQARAEKALGLSLSVQVNELGPDQLRLKRQAMHAYKTQYVMTNFESFGGLGRIGRRNYEVILLAN